MEPTTNQTPNYSAPVRKGTKALVKTRLLIILGAVVVVVIAGILLINLIRNNNKQNVQIGTSDGVFTSFSATATGTVTKISDKDIEIENNKVKKSFKLSENLLITHKSLIDKLADILVPEVSAQAIPPRPPLPSDTQSATNSAGIPNIPPPPRKKIGDIKAGDLVNLSLIKSRQADDWVVTGISVLPK